MPPASTASQGNRFSPWSSPAAKNKPQLRFALAELETFLVVVEEESFSRAADRMCISQPSVSNRIKRLEDALRVKLLKRTTRNVQLTEDGKLLSAAAHEALNGLMRTLGELRDHSEAARNRVVIASTPMIAAIFMPDIIHSYGQRYPDIQVTLRDIPYSQLLQSIADGSADIGVIALDSEIENMLFHPLAEEDIVLVASETHPLARMKKIKLEMLLPFRMIFLERYASLREHLAGEFARRGVSLETSTTSTLPALMGLVDTGSCVTFLPRSMAQNNARHPRVIMNMHDFRATRRYGSIMAKKLAPTAAVQSFYEHLHREFESLMSRTSGRLRSRQSPASDSLPG